MANIIKMLLRGFYSRSDNNSSESSVPLAEWVEPPNTTEEEPIVPLAPLPNMSDVPPTASATPTATTPGATATPTAVANGATGTPTATTTVAKARTSDDDNIFSVLYSVGKKVAIVGSIYLVGYMGWSVAWLIAPVILSVARDQMAKTSEKKRDIAKSSALANEKDVILARIDELPAWVYFPDVERAEWLNKVRKENASIFKLVLLSPVLTDPQASLAQRQSFCPHPGQGNHRAECGAGLIAV